MEVVILTWLGEVFIYLWSIPWVQFAVYHILLNLVVAVMAAIHTAEFQLAKLGEFYWRKLLPYIGLFAASEALGPAIGIGWLGTAVFAMIETKLFGDLVDNLKKLGVPIPQDLVKTFKK